MPNLRETQYDSLVKSYINRVNNFTIIKPTVSDLKNLYNMVLVNIYNKIERTFSNTNTVSFDISRWNDMLESINNDIETLTNHSYNNITSLDESSKIFKIMTSFLKSLANNIEKSMALLYNKNQNVSGSTLNIPIDILNTFDMATSENIYIDRYNLNVKVYNSITSNDNIGNIYDIVTKTLDIYIDPNDMQYIKSGTRNKETNTYIYYSDYFTKLTLFYDIVMPSNQYSFNFVSLDFDDSKKYNIEMNLTKSDNSIVTISDITSDTVFVQKNAYKKVSIKIIIKKPTYKTTNDYVYVYGLKNVIFSNRINSDNAVISLKNIQIDTSYNKLAIDVEHSNNTFSYYINYNNTLYNVTSISSLSKEINLNKNEIHVLVAPQNITKSWSLVPTTQYGGVQLYGILDILKDTNSEIIDVDGRLENYNNISNITIYRGYQDWKITYKEQNNLISVDNIYIKITKDENGNITNGNSSLPIHVNTFKINNFTISQDETRITIVVNGNLIYPEMMKFINSYTNEIIAYSLDANSIAYNSDTNTTSFDILITSSGFGTESEINEYEVDYYITLFSYLKIYNYTSIITKLTVYNENNIDISNNNLFFITRKLDANGQLTDYIFNIASFIKNEYIYIKYEYKVLNMPPIKIYTTTVICDTPETITILPFTNSELSMGNYHSVNSLRVSQSTSYTLQAGINYIESTQPMPSYQHNAATYFANQFTMASSNAGIVLPSFLRYYAYDKPLIQIAVNELSMIIDSNDNRQYALDDGRIYINKCPEYIPSIYFTDTMNKYDATGETLLCKSPVYDASNNLTEFIPHPETFYITFIYNLEKLSSFIDILIRYNKEQKEVYEQPSVSNITVLQYK